MPWDWLKNKGIMKETKGKKIQKVLSRINKARLIQRIIWGREKKSKENGWKRQTNKQTKKPRKDTI